MTGLNTAFPIAFALNTSEDEPAFTWCLQKLHKWALAWTIPEPLVALTDCDLALKNALTAVFEDTQQQLCIWHILKNIAKYIKTHWQGNRGIVEHVPTHPNVDQARQTYVAQQEAQSFAS